MEDDEKAAQMRASMGKLQDASARMLDLAIRHPRTSAGERALIWLVISRPFGPESNMAWELLARDHARSDRITEVLSPGLESLWASRAVEDLLRNASEQNPYREVRGLAGYWLARVFQRRAQFLRLWPLQRPRMAERLFDPQDLDRVVKQDPRALEHRAARLYDRVIAEFPRVPFTDPRPLGLLPVLGRAAPALPDVAKVDLDALRRLSVGKPAPQIEGLDLDGRPMKLSDFRGKVVVLALYGFWGDFVFPPEFSPRILIGNLGQLARTVEGKPVALLGVVASYREEHKEAARAKGLPIRFWWDPDQQGPSEFGRMGGPRPGPIRTAWDARSPNMYVIDARGLIRYTLVFDPETLEKAVATVLKEPEGRPDRQHPSVSVRLSSPIGESGLVEIPQGGPILRSKRFR